jgi:hypothetical protein
MNFQLNLWYKYLGQVIYCRMLFILAVKGFVNFFCKNMDCFFHF